MKSDEMRAVLARWSESGLSLRAFGIKENIGYAKLMYWRKRLDSPARVREKIELSPVHVVPDDVVTTKAETIGVWLPNGVSLDVPPSVASEDLVRLVQALSQC